MRLTLLATLVTVIGAFVLLTAPTTTPITAAEPEFYCGSDLLHDRLLDQDSAYAERTRRLESDYQRKMAEPQPKSLPAPFVIPVVFHIVHNGGSENISDADVLESLAHLNQSFANTDYYDQGTGVNTQIQFCLAERTPDNQSTSGITRTVSALTDLDADSEDLDLKNLIRYQPTDYVNIWIVKEICGLGLGCGVAGYAYLPGAHGGSRDGIVVEAKWLGKSEANSSVLTHEMGHYLGLRHTFQGGCLNDDCTAQGDFVCDTPPDNSTAAVPCSGSVNTCTTDTDSGFATDQDDLFNNYMDYGYWSCYNAFTAGQRDRMHFFLDGRRRSLTNSPACLPPCPAPVTAGFSGGDVTVDVGTTLTFTNSSTNATSYQWKLDGAPFSTATDASNLFGTVGSFRVRLIASSGDPLCFPDSTEQTVTVVCPVTSGFDGTFTGIQAGESATYTSTATNATSLSWTVNGTAAGTGTTLDYTFVAPGLYTICLTADNGFCTAEQCRNLVVRNAVTSCDSTQFARRYPTGEITGPTSVLHVPDSGGSEYLVAEAPGGLRVLRLGADGEVVQGQRLFDFTQQNLLPVAGLALGSGELVVAVNRVDPTNLNNTNTAGLLRLNVDDGTLLWYSEMEGNAYGTALAPVPGTNAVLWTVVRGNSSTFRSEVLRVDTATGNIAAGQSEPWRPADGQLAFNDLTVGGPGHLLAGSRRGPTPGGTFDVPVVAARSTTGILNWELEIPSLPGSAVAIDQVDGNWVALINGLTPNSSSPALYLAAGSAADGSISWIRRYLFPAMPDLIWRDLLATSDGGWLALLAPAKGNADFPASPVVLLKVSGDGTPEWARRFSDLGFGRARPSGSLSESSDGFRLLAQGAGDAQPVRYNLDQEGWIAGDCDGIQTAEVESLLLEWETSVPGLSATPPVTPAAPRQAGIETETLASELLCAGGCPEEGDCGAPFVYLYEADSPAEGSALVLLPDGYFFGGQAYGNPVVTATDADGTVQWALNLFPPGNGGTITELRQDEAGFLFGVGRYRTQTGEGYFAFRINPANQTVLWTTPLEIPTGAPREVRVSGISADGLPDQYEISGTLDNLSTATEDQFLYWHLDRNTGSTITATTAYDNGFGGISHAQSIAGGNRYLAGTARIDGPGDERWRPVVTAVDAAGQVLWSKYYLTPATATARLRALAIAPTPTGFSLLSSGDGNGTDLTTDQLWLSRHDATGLLLEARELTLPTPVRAEQLATNASYTAILALDDSATPYLLLLDASGNFRWGRRFPSLRYTNPGRGTSLHLTADGIYLLATRDVGVASIALVRLTLEGESVGSCLPGEAIDVGISPLENPFQSDFDSAANESVVAPGLPFGAEPSFLQLADFSCPIDCPDQDCPECEDCGEPFLYTFDETGTWTTIVDGTAGYYLGGQISQEPALAALDRQGNLTWQLRILPPGQTGYVSEVALDADGLLYGHGRYAPPGEALRYSFIFRIDPSDGSLLWARTFSTQFESVELSTMLEAGTDQYELIGTSDFNNTVGTCDALFYTVDRATGQTLGVRREYHGIACESFFRGKRMPNGDVVTSGRFGIGAVGPANLRPTLTRLAPDGTELWSRYYLRTGNETARLYAWTLARGETDKHTFLVSGDGDGTDFSSAELWLVRTDLDGNPLATTQLTFPEPVVGLELLKADFGYLLFAVTDTDEPMLVAVDAAGAVLWSRRYPGLRQEIFYLKDPIRLTAEGILLTASLTATGTPALLRLDAEGNPPDGCIEAELFTVTAESLPAIFEAAYNLDAYPGNNDIQGSATAAPLNLTPSALSCPLDCEEEEICDDGIDNDGDGLVDCEDPDLALDCCCTQVPPLELGPDTTLCSNAPLMIAADTGFVDYLWQDGIMTRERTIDAPGTYSLIATDSCGRTASDTLQVRLLTTPTLDLGPDTVVCSESVLPLDAGPGFASYRWIDGSTDPTFTAWGEGSFWVEATDSCGTVQRDTVTVSFDPATVIDLGKIREACPGDTLQLRVDGFTEYTWYPETGFDCRTCPEVTYTVGSDTLVWIVAKTATGCVSTDSLRIVSTPGVGSFATAELCTGDTLAFGDTLITTTGEYYQPVATGCFAQDTLRVSVLPTASGSSSAAICAGDSLLIGGRYRKESGTYVDTLTAANGCDSLQTISLTVFPSPVLSSEIELCPGDSVLVFDRYESTAGIYERIFSTAAGCDSTVSIRVTVSSLDLAVQAIQGACGQRDEGIALATATGGTGPYTYTWSDGRTTRQIDQLPPGDYGVTITDARGCTLASTVSIDVEGVVLPTWTLRPESCLGAADGSLRILDPIDGYTYALGEETGTLFSGLEPGTYSLQVTSPGNCSDTASVLIEAARPLLVDLPGDTLLRLGDSLLVVPVHNADPGVNFQWEPADILDCDSCRRVVVTPLESVILRLTLRDSLGCVATDELFIRVDRQDPIYLPTAFSPNGDGANERWRPYPGPSVRRIPLVQIFDRWGNLVYEARDLDLFDPNVGWDGTFEGRTLNPAVFVYRVAAELMDGETIERAGEVMLLR